MSSGERGGRGWRSLGGQRDFQLVYKEGVKRIGRLFVLYLYPGDDLARAVVASRKVGGAVTRNRAKRLLREAIRDRIENRPGAAAEIRRRYLPAAPPGAGLWVVAVARGCLAEARCPEVIEEFDRLLDRPPAVDSRPDGPSSGQDGEGAPRADA